MGKGRFVNQKLGKRVHRGIDQLIRKTKTQDQLRESQRMTNNRRNTVEPADDKKQE
jgi:hypothetical protein